MCKSCGTSNQCEFISELCIHFSRPQKPAVFAFPVVLVCLSCGFTEFTVAETELRQLGKSDSIAA